MDPSADGCEFSRLVGIELTDVIALALQADEIAIPTEVQKAGVKPILDGHHVVLDSGTGTGKTLAYLLPILQRLRQSSTDRALCIAPAAELAIQTLRVAERYKAPEISATALVATGNQRHQTSRLQKSTRLVVGTPGRVLEMYEKRKLRGINIVVLDEPEPILASRDAGALRGVLTRPEPKVQFVLSGATFGSQSEAFIRECMGADVVRTHTTDAPLVSQISHQLVRVRHEGEKDVVLVRYLAAHHIQRAIVFANQPHVIRHLYRTLNAQQIRSVTVSLERTKQQRAQALREFSSSKASVLLTTDQAARGLDMPGVDWVLHFELPRSPNAYVHRAGRTGRAGGTGTSVVFVSEADRPLVSRLERGLGFEFRHAALGPRHRGSNTPFAPRK